MSAATCTTLDQGDGVDASAGVPTVPSASAVSNHGHVEVDNVNGTPVKLCYELVGNGSNKVLFITGVHTAGAALEDQLAYFSKKPEYQCLLFDHRTVGRSTGSPKAAVSLQQYTNDVEMLLQNVGWPASNTHIVGFGSGGLVALELAYHFDKLRSLTLVNASGAGKMLPLEGVKWYAQLKLAKDERRRVKILSRLLYSKKWLKLPAAAVSYEGKTNLDVVCEKIARDHHIAAPEDQHLEEQKTADIDRHRVSKRRLESIRMKNFPMLLICGTRDRLVHPGNSKYLARVLQCTLESFAGSGHALASECPQRLNELLEGHFRTSGASITTGSQGITARTATTKDSVAIEPQPQRNAADDRNTSVDAEDVVRGLDIKGSAAKSSQTLSERCSTGTDSEEIETAEPVVAGSDWEDTSSNQKSSGASDTPVTSRIAHLPVQPEENDADTAGKSDDGKPEPGFSLAPAMRDVFAPLETKNEHDEALVSGLRKPESLGSPGFSDVTHPSFNDTWAERHPEEATVIPQSTMPMETSGTGLSEVEATAILADTQVKGEIVPVVATVTVASDQGGLISTAAPTELMKVTAGHATDATNGSGLPVSVLRENHITKPSNPPGAPEHADWSGSPLVANNVVVTTVTDNYGAESITDRSVMLCDANDSSSIAGQIGNWQLDPALMMSKKEQYAETVTKELPLEEHMIIDHGLMLPNRTLIDGEATLCEATNQATGATNATQAAWGTEDSPTIDDTLTAGSMEFTMRTIAESGSRTSDTSRGNNMKREEYVASLKDVEPSVPQTDHGGRSITDFIRGVVGKVGDVKEIVAGAVADAGHDVVDKVGEVKHEIAEKVVEVKDEVVSKVEGITGIIAGRQHTARGDQVETLIPDRSIAAGEQPKQKDRNVADGQEKDVANKVHSVLDDLSANAYSKSVSVMRNAEEVPGEEGHDVPSSSDECHRYRDEDAVRGVDQDVELPYLAEGMIPGAFDDAEEQLELQNQNAVDKEVPASKLQSKLYGVPANGDDKPAPKIPDGKNVHEHESRQGVPSTSYKDRYDQGEHGGVLSPLRAMCGVRRNLEYDDHTEGMIPGAFDDVVEQPKPQDQNGREADEQGVANKVRSLLDNFSAKTDAKPAPTTQDAGDVRKDERPDNVMPSIDDGRQCVDREEHGGILSPLRAIRGAVGVVGHIGDGFIGVTDKTRCAATSVRNIISSHSTMDDTGRAFARREQPSLEDSALSAMVTTPQPDNHAERGVKSTAPLTFRFELSAEEAREVLRQAREEVECAPMKETSPANIKTAPVPIDEPLASPLKPDADGGHAIGEKVAVLKDAVAGTAEEGKEAVTEAFSDVTSAVTPPMPKMVTSRPSDSAAEPVGGALTENTGETTADTFTSDASASTYR